jgi:predicted PurR-regulated permease PerM
MERLNTLLRRWIFAQLIGMIVSGIGTYIGLRLIGIEQAAALAVLTAIFSLVPNFGELIAVGGSLAVAAVQAPDRLMWVVVVIYGVSFLQNQVIGPLVTAESVNIPPVLILLGQIIVAGFFGVIGIILAVPILVIGMVVVQEVYIKDILGDDSPGDLTAVERVIAKHGYKLSRRPSDDMTDGLQPDGV